MEFLAREIATRELPAFVVGSLVERPGQPLELPGMVAVRAEDPAVGSDDLLGENHGRGVQVDEIDVARSRRAFDDSP